MKETLIILMYFTNTSSQQQKANFVEHDEVEILELIDQDTSKKGEINAEHYIQYHDERSPFWEKKKTKIHK